jgi:hypothetical protein
MGVASSSTTEIQQRALAAVLTSATFSKNPRLIALLQYLCAKHFEGETESIKEYNIATDVFDRPADFDQSSDAIVRVEMHRLRKKLKEFYSNEGAQQPLEIVIQSGRYLPEFIPRSKHPEMAEAVADLPPVSGSTSVLKVSRKTSSPGIFVALAMAAVGLVLVALITLPHIFGKHTAHNKHIQRTASPIQLPPAAIRPQDGVRLLCGSSKSSYRDRQGNEWGADAFYSGGIASEVAMQTIYRTRDASLFRRMRSGEFSYEIPLKAGIYELRLYFADTSYAPGSAMDGGENIRVFSVMLNGNLALRNYDIITDAGPSTADIKVVKDVTPAKDGYLHIAFIKGTGVPLINAIEIVPAAPHLIRPIRIITQESTFTDRNGVTWYPDDYFLGGRTIARFGTIIGPEDPEIYARERYGNFSYAIPVADGRYAATLRFAETFWGPENQGGGGTGSRVFDVYCNGTVLLKNFDMFQEGGSHREIIKTFHGLQPNGQGKLLFSFVPQINYANVSAIEVVGETE